MTWTSGKWNLDGCDFLSLSYGRLRTSSSPQPSATEFRLLHERAAGDLLCPALSWATGPVRNASFLTMQHFAFRLSEPGPFSSPSSSPVWAYPSRTKAGTSSAGSEGPRARQLWQAPRSRLKSCNTCSIHPAFNMFFSMILYVLLFTFFFNASSNKPDYVFFISRVHIIYFSFNTLSSNIMPEKEVHYIYFNIKYMNNGCCLHSFSYSSYTRILH